jgi:hypothetical protein
MPLSVLLDTNNTNIANSPLRSRGMILAFSIMARKLPPEQFPAMMNVN